MVGGGELPIGTIITYSSTGNPPGFLECNGASISRDMYPDLFNVIGTTFGNGDGETTFNLPDLRGRFLEGDITPGTIKNAGLPNITGESVLLATGSGSGRANGETYTVGSIVTTYRANHNVIDGSSGKWAYFSLNASRSSSIYGNSDTVQPNSLTVRYLIKAFTTAIVETGAVDYTKFAQDLANRCTRNQIPCYNKIDKITTSSTYVTPVTGWYKITAKGGGGGGGGAYVVTSSNYYFPGAGGGEGSTVKVYKYLTKGTSCVCSIGAGGTGGSAAFNDTSKSNTNDSVDGGSTTVTIGSLVINAYGGNKAYRSNGSGIGGVGGYASSVTGDNAVSYKIINGMNGQYGIMQNFAVSAAEHHGGLGGGYRTNADNFPAYGEGGIGGKCYATATYTRAGSNGTQGVVIFEYFDPSL